MINNATLICAQNGYKFMVKAISLGYRNAADYLTTKLNEITYQSIQDNQKLCHMYVRLRAKADEFSDLSKNSNMPIPGLTIDDLSAYDGFWSMLFAEWEPMCRSTEIAKQQLNELLFEVGKKN